MNVSTSFSKAKSKSFIDPKQAPYLDFARNQGRGLARRQMPRAQDWSERRGGGLFDFGRESLESLQDNPWLARLQQQTQADPAVLQQMTQQLGTDIGQQFNEQILPGIRRDSTAIGALGGSRQGLAEGVASRGAMDAFSRGASNMAFDWQNADSDRQLRAAQTGAQLFGQGGQVAAGGVNELFGGVGMGQFMGGFAPLGAFSDIVGQPTVLNKSRDFSYSGSFGMGGGGGGTT